MEQIFICRNARALLIKQAVIDTYGHGVATSSGKDLASLLNDESTYHPLQSTGIVHMVSENGQLRPTRSTACENLSEGDWFGVRYSIPFQPKASDVKVYTFRSSVGVRECTETERKVFSDAVSYEQALPMLEWACRGLRNQP